MDIREEFLKFFESKGHEVVQSSLLVPEDETLLFTNAGMVPFKSIFTGELSVPKPPRAASCQTCIRAGGKHNDLDNVGYTARHHTFFEMLGNFSFGDYFKEKAIAYAWEFVTEVLKFDKNKLWVTVHTEDDEAENIWSQHIDKSKIVRFGDKDNFWQMGDTGPCGPCSEIFIDQGAEHFNGVEDYMGGDGDRFLEIWNLVFMQYERGADGKLTPLPKPSIDTGMGLERVTAIKEGKLNNYESSLFMPLIEKTAQLCGKPYSSDSGASYRVIADHIRSVAFLLAQGVNFDKEGRGYVLRRILRRAVRHGYLLGLREPFMYKLIDVLSDLMGEHYTYLTQKKEMIKGQIFLEEERFFATIASGLELFESELKKTKNEFSADTAFKLYDTFGFPLDLTQDMLRDKKISVDIGRFDELMSEQKKRAKASWKGSGDKAVHGDFKELLESFGVNRFVGYETTKTKAKILALLDDNFKRVEKLNAKTCGWVLLDVTPFYAQSGGQCGDSGELAGKAQVLDTQKFFELNLIHVNTNTVLRSDEEVEAIVEDKRIETAKHHSATHLLHSALRAVLGHHVTQAGSLVEDERLRFDFSHPKALSVQELKQVEDFVNNAILSDIPNITQEMNMEDAKKSGAIALFGEKYGSVVRVVKFGDISVEFCGGVHVKSTGTIGSFLIIKESGVSAGVRRIEAFCGKAALNAAKSWREELGKIREEVKNKDILIGVERLKNDIKELKGKINSLESNISKKIEGVMIEDVEVIVDELKAGDIKNRIDEIKNQKDKVAVLFFQEQEGRVTIASGSKNNIIKAGAWIKEIASIVGGGGGGRDDFAQAGGKDASKIQEAKKAALKYAEKILKG
ncbi:MAG: alanine--tRNA ligase [Campylobacteraceae bacterium]|jgi:alanyl-tRNA synthetase|nr:alanine--tRNA ligase [Campylobacteraceae bacterium]